MRRRGLWLLLGVGCAVLFWGARTLWIAGVWRPLEPHFAGQCTPVRGIPGVEDLTIHPRTGLVYLSSCDRFARERGEPPRGALYAYSLDAGVGAVPVPLTPDVEPDFCPHGLSLWVAPGGGGRLFVIDHSGGEHAIRIYETHGQALEYVDTLHDPLLRSPKDLVAVGPEELYVSNDHRFPDGVARVLEEWLRLPVSDVVRWDGAAFRKVAAGIRLPNGVNVDAGARRVYVASALGREVRVYDRDAATGALRLAERVPVGSVPDKIEVDEGGALWIGAHPRPIELVRYRNHRSPRAPSQALRVHRQADGSWQVEEVYLSSGDTFSAASVAARRGDRLLIGAIYDDGFLDCRLP